MVFGCWA
jgi:hypothetical protein